MSIAHLHKVLLRLSRALRAEPPIPLGAVGCATLLAPPRRAAPPPIVEQWLKQQHLLEEAARHREQSCSWKGGALGRKGGPAAGCRPFAIAPRSSAQGMPASGPRTYLLRLPAPMSAMGGHGTGSYRFFCVRVLL